MGLFYRINMNSNNIFNARGNNGKAGYFKFNSRLLEINNANNIWTKWTP